MTAAPARRRRRSAGRGTDGRRSTGVTILLCLAALSVLLPLYLTVSMALKTGQQAAEGSGFSWPSPVDLSSFGTAWRTVGFGRAATISAIVALLTVAGCLLTSSMAAYAIVRNWDRRLFRWSYYYLLAAMFIPFPAAALPQVKLTAVLRLDNPVGVALLHVLFATAFNLLLLTTFLRSVPLELEESARLDGCSTGQVFRRVILPLMAPMNATVGIFAFLQSWNDYMLPAMITGDPADQTLPVVQYIFQTSLTVSYDVAFASYLMAMAPTLVVYLLAQRWVLSGVTRGAIR